MKLDKKRKAFCRYKAEGYSNEESGIKAGYSASYAKARSHKLSEDCRIQEEIKRLTAKKQAAIEKEFNYSVVDSFKKFEAIQSLALTKNPDKPDLNAAIKAEENKAKLYGCYEQDNKQKINTTPFKIEIVE